VQSWGTTVRGLSVRGVYVQKVMSYRIGSLPGAAQFLSLSRLIDAEFG